MFPLLLTTLAGAGLMPIESGTEETSRFAGEWSLVQTRDERRAEAGSEHIRMSVARDGSVVFTFDGLVTNHGKLVVRTGGKGEWVDLVCHNGKRFAAVFHLDGDRLVLCFAEEERPRPAGLAPRGTQWAEHWKRTKR